MAGGLTISTLNDDTGILATQNGMSGIAKAWVNYNGVAQTIRGSFNISSVTYNSTGTYTINFTTAFPDANYTVIGSVGNSSGAVIFRAMPDGVVPTTSSCQVVVIQTNFTAFNSAYVMIQFNR